LERLIEGRLVCPGRYGIIEGYEEYVLLLASAHHARSRIECLLSRYENSFPGRISYSTAHEARRARTSRIEHCTSTQVEQAPPLLSCCRRWAGSPPLHRLRRAGVAPEQRCQPRVGGEIGEQEADPVAGMLAQRLRAAAGDADAPGLALDRGRVAEGPAGQHRQIGAAPR